MQALVVLEHVRGLRDPLLAFLETLVLVETPSADPGTQSPAFELLSDAFGELDFGVQLHPGAGGSGGCLEARPRRAGADDRQLMLGHVDTVWPVGTLQTMPLERRGGSLHGPGVYDMKGGLTQMVFALRALRELDLTPSVTPEVFINSDEEIGSRESTAHIVRLATGADRALVLEPSAGHGGLIKTARKGIGRFTVTIHGRAAHAGLDPESGASAIQLSHQIQALYGLNDTARGVTVNVGCIDGGIGANVVAPRSSATVDVRVPTHADAARLEAAIRALKPTREGVEIEVEGHFGRPPMERGAGTEALWLRALAIGERLGLDLAETAVGGASDGNTTARYCPTLDGLGPVGDGAHSRAEHVWVEPLLERTALLAMLLLEPRLGIRSAP